MERSPRYIQLVRFPPEDPSLFVTDGTAAMEPFMQARRFLPGATIPFTPDWEPECGLDVAAPELVGDIVFYIETSQDPITRSPEGVEHARILCVDPNGTAVVGVLPDRHEDGTGRRKQLWMRLFRAQTGPDGYRVIHAAWRAALIDARIEAELQRIYVAEGCDPAGEAARAEAALVAAEADGASYKRRVQELLLKHGLDDASRLAAQRKLLEDANLTSDRVNDRREAIARERRAGLKARLRLEQPHLFEELK